MKMKLLGGFLAGATLIAGLAKAEETISAVHAFPELLSTPKAFCLL